MAGNGHATLALGRGRDRLERWGRDMWCSLIKRAISALPPFSVGAFMNENAS
jgi:hypothetical protein